MLTEQVSLDNSCSWILVSHHAVVFSATSIQVNRASGSVTTLFDRDAAANGGIFFDLEGTGAVAVTITALDLNFEIQGSTGTVEVWTRAGTVNGNEQTAAGWTSVGSSATFTTKNFDTPTAVPGIPSFSVMPGEIVGVAIVTSLPHSYSDGDSTNEIYLSSDGLLQVTGFSIGSAPFTGGGILNFPRVVNANIYYDYDEMEPECNVLNWMFAVIVKVLTLGLVRWCGL